MWKYASKLHSRRLGGPLVRHYRVLAIESSCDDSCVALLDKYLACDPPKIIGQSKSTLNSAKEGGIIPTAAHEFHQMALADLVQGFCAEHNLNSHSPPDLICCTRGPGMVGSLSAGIQTAKGLSIAWNRPLIGVHHMLGHVLTAILPKKSQPDLAPPRYPYLSLLCSGGHTMLVLLKSITDHKILINTSDIAAGDSIDKCARVLGIEGNMRGKELEKYVANIPEDLKAKFSRINTNSADNEFKLQMRLPLKGPSHLKVPDVVEFVFSQFQSTLQRFKEVNFPDQNIDKVTKQFVAYKIQETIFDHLIDRINIAFFKHGLSKNGDGELAGVRDFICSGGVAANQTLRKKLSENLTYDTNLQLSPDDMVFHFPDIALCTDNAVMIGTAGIEILENLKVKSDLKFLPIRRWPMNELLDVDGWVGVSDAEFHEIRKF